MPLFIESRSAKPADAPLSIDLDGITPDRLATLTAAEIAALPVTADGRRRPLGTLFTVGGDMADGRIDCGGDFSRVHRVGAGMAAGTMTVRGDVGRHAGEGMTGGTLTISGNAGDWLAAEMTGGSVRVGGRAGDNVAGALPGSPVGMRGGVVVVEGDAGCLAGARMRRGLLAIGGDCGEAAAFEMRAGTVLVAGRAGRRPGMGMRRGTLIFPGTIPDLPPTFTRGAVWTPTILRLLANRLDRAGFRPGGRPPDQWTSAAWQQWHGDAIEGGRGEIFHRCAAG
jgi:formylmethanofuran dehydrogenase subunit C